MNDPNNYEPVEYTVVWKIDLQARSLKEAAELALEIQKDPDSTATCFEVCRKGSVDTIKVDLNEIDEDYWPCSKCQMGFLWDDLQLSNDQSSHWRHGPVLVCKSCSEEDKK